MKKKIAVFIMAVMLIGALPVFAAELQSKDSDNSSDAPYCYNQTGNGSGQGYHRGGGCWRN
ncbi:MAG: hypothetical protein WCS30_11095 [Selenomonadaceae bacterium]|jgi:hypothetical protein